MPDIASTRYELFDAPLFTARMAELCPNCDVIYLNADADPAAEQQEQANSVLSQGADVIVLDPVDSTAAATIVNAAQGQGVPIIAYDRPIPDAAADFYVSFDNFAIGAAITQSLVDHLDAEGAEGGVLQVNGSPTDAAAGLIGDGIHSVLDESGYEILAEFDTPGWQPPEAQNWVSGQITRFPDQIVGVVAANDGTGGAAIAAFKAAGVDVPPVTGNDAELAALQRIIAGDQFNTISKPIHIVAEASADVAFAFLQGEAPESDTELFDTPSYAVRTDRDHAGQHRRVRDGSGRAIPDRGHLHRRVRRRLRGARDRLTFPRRDALPSRPRRDGSAPGKIREHRR